MKSIKLFLILALILFPALVYSDAIIPISAGEATSDSAVVSGSCRFFGALVLTDGTNDATVILYDNSSAAGTKIFEAVVTGGDNYGGLLIAHPEGILCYTGIYLDIEGTGASVIVYYNPRGR